MWIWSEGPGHRDKCLPRTSDLPLSPSQRPPGTVNPRKRRGFKRNGMLLVQIAQPMLSLHSTREGPSWKT